MGKAIGYILGSLIFVGGAAFAALSMWGDPMGILPLLGIEENKPRLVVAAQNPDNPAPGADATATSSAVPPQDNLDNLFEPRPTTAPNPNTPTAMDRVEEFPDIPAPVEAPRSSPQLRKADPQRPSRRGQPPHAEVRAMAAPVPAEANSDGLKGRVAAVESVKLPALAAGPLAEIKVAKGDMVKKDELVALIDKTELTAQRQIKESEYKAARTKATDNIDEKFAKASADVAESNVRKLKDSNKRVPSSVPAIEVEKAELEATKAKLQIEKAQHDRKVDGLTALAKWAEIKSVDVAIDHRMLIAPFDGEVVETKSKLGEWVAAGETVLEMISLNVLNIDVDVPAKNYRPGELSNRSVRVEVRRGDKGADVLEGTIIFARPIISNGDTIACTVEVTNRRTASGLDWVLYPGETVDITIGAQAEPNGNARRNRMSEPK
jgi:multidrug efflux pump subunit AcrA (membrane-fusion protein)